MAEIRVFGIISEQYISAKSGSGSLTILDLQSGSILNISLYKQTVGDDVVAKKQPQNWVFGGCQLRSFQGRNFLTADTIAVAKPAGQPA